MLRVGLTGGLGSGKSTIADIFQSLGAHVIKADAIGREVMLPGHAIYDEIVARFGTAILRGNGEIDRAALARIVFEGEDAAARLDALNAIVHPAVIAVQMDWMEQLAEREPTAVAMVESALIFETKYDELKSGNRKRAFDRVLLVTAPDDVKVSRFVARTLAGRTVTAAEHDAIEADARRRLALQLPDADKAARCDFVIDNGGRLTETEKQVRRLYIELSAEARSR